MQTFSLKPALFIAGLAVSVTAAAAAPKVPGLPPAAQQAMQQIIAPRISADVRFLSSDLLEGRGTGTRGGDIAADYIATQFALNGLKPAGDDGSFLQKVRFTGVTTEPDTTTAEFVTDKGEVTKLKYADDYVLNDETGKTSDNIDAPIVFVGFGIDAPEYHWDDFKGTDVKGKMLLLFVNEPESQDQAFFNGPALTYYGRWSYKYEEAARLGAAGVLIIHRTDLASYPWDVVRNSWTGEDVQLADDHAPKVEAASWIQLEQARKLFASAGLDLDAMYHAANQRDFKPIELPVHFKAHVDSKVRHFESSNVVGLLPGRDPGPPKQVVVYTAHYDHLGIVPGKGKDDIYNGAVDNGTGCGMLLELMRVYANGREKPPHPILFASVTAEEKGLLGSRYLGEHLPMPARDVALDLNYDAILPIGEPSSITATGAERTTVYPTLQKLAKVFGLAIEPDAKPGAGHYYRSDHFSFARVGVPAFSIGQGASFVGHPREWGVEQEEDYVAHHYHQPSDEWRPDMDFSGNVKLAQFGYALGWLVSEQKTPTGWVPGDEFEKARKAE